VIEDGSLTGVCKPCTGVWRAEGDADESGMECSGWKGRRRGTSESNNGGGKQRLRWKAAIGLSKQVTCRPVGFR
jgi:hypothetical protein